MTKTQHTGVLRSDLPSEIREQTRYIYKVYDKIEQVIIIPVKQIYGFLLSQIAPYITEGNTAFVHHVLIIYLRSGLNDSVVGQAT